jgi:DNA-binding transcriptional regulator LsrR (DeoR family)
MKHSTRALIRQLYFVEHLPVDQIAAELRLRARTVRRALVVKGGVPDRRIALNPTKETP